MAEETILGKNGSEEEIGGCANEEEEKKKQSPDPEYLCCMMQPITTDTDPVYVGVRRLLLRRKSESGVLGRRYEWRCNGKGYVAYRNFISRPRKWENVQTPSILSSPGNSGRWLPSPSPLSHLYEVESFTSSRDLRSVNQVSSHRASFSSSLSDSDHPYRRGVEQAFSFVGMHCIFDQCQSAVTVLKFGHMSSDLLAYGASDGTLTVCSVSEQPSVLKQLTGHTKDVTDFDFSSNNQYIASSSLDKTIRVWELSKGVCIRVIYGTSAQLCIRFHPVNNNFLSAGNANKEIAVYNFSTGRTIKKLVFDDEVTSMDHDHTGHLIFCGDAHGTIYSVSMDSHTGSLSRSHRHRGSHKSPVTTVKYRSFSLLASGPVLLTCTQDGNLCFFGVALEIKGYLTLRCSLKLAPRIHRIQASFCPLLSLEKGEYIVAGSEDSNVYFYDLTKPKHTCVNKLQGHRFPVTCVGWNHGENLLASSDFYGVVIVWKRANKTSS
ncbi:PREDICTED: WD repeat-containing protein 13 [Tarenaya hassleriana]|uniref:WD repeat-containing protein 13 n=1 Tax=Tarenaya hassleriana TaxID=28532 RepID=UPI00053C701D|nr:PREDICTED: WD repeat-containing protein 13 [Tarenaya hassleriana]